MKVAIVHDYLIDYGGAEDVLVSLHEMFPKAPIYVSILNKKRLGEFYLKFKDAKIIVSWFNYLPFADRLISPFRFLIPFIWSSFNFSEYDLIISSSSWAVTKGFKNDNLPAGRQVEICYLHTPPRYLYGYDTSRKFTGFVGKLVYIYGLLVNRIMRVYDFKQAQKVDYFIANSKNVGLRIEKFYKRSDYKIIYPPVDLEEISNSTGLTSNEEFYLTGGRMVAAKNFDVIIRSFNKNGMKLKTFGKGTEEENLKRIAKTNIEFLGRIDEQEKYKLLKSCKAFILAQTDEDLGITALEVQAAGKPAIAYRGGGYIETIIEYKTGLFFDDLSIESINKTINKFEKRSFRQEDCINQAKKFSKERFKKEMLQFIDEKLKEI